MQTGFIKGFTDFFSDDNGLSILAYKGFSFLKIIVELKIIIKLDY